MKAVFKNKPQQYVVAFLETARQYGPFKTGAAAVSWAEKNLGSGGHHWVVKPLSNPF